MAWPSAFSPGTLGYMKDRIADELMRPDLTTQIAAAINDAIIIYQKERFRFNETFLASFMTNVGQQNYTTISATGFPAITSFEQYFHIDWATITVPPAVFDLPRINPENLLILTQTGTQMGQPYCYAFSNETFMLYPVPSSGGPGQISQFNTTGGVGYNPGVYTQVPLTGGSGNSATANLNVVAGVVINVALVNPGVGYLVGDVLSATTVGPGAGFTVTVTGTFTGPTGPYLISVGGHVAYQAPQSDSETGNKWMTDAERLIRSRAKYQLAQHVTRNGPMANAMSPVEPGTGQLPGATYEAWRELRVESNRMARRGVITPMFF